MRTTLKQVAELAGVSTTTASFVLNNRKQARTIARATRERVRAAARQLGYQPHQNARSLRMRRTETIGVLMGRRLDMQLGAIFEGVNRGAREHGYRCIPITVGPNEDAFEAANELLNASQADGLIIADRNHEFSREVVAAIASVGRPLALVGRYMADPPCLCVCDDYRRDGERGTEHLISIGRSDILFVGPDNDNSTEFLRGAQEAFRRHDLPWDDARFVPAPFTDHFMSRRTAIRVVDRYLHERQTMPGAVFALENRTLYGILQVLQDRRTPIPSTTAVLGYGDYEMLYATFTPHVSGFLPATTRLGASAAQALIEHMAQHGGAPLKPLIQMPGRTSLRARASTNRGEPLPPPDCRPR